MNDRHSALNRTSIARRIEPHRVDDVVRAVKKATDSGESLAIAGARHAMGGQQFLTGGTLLDMRTLNRVRRFDTEHGLIEAEAGITWPDLIRGYLVPQGSQEGWGIRQKQTGADRLTLGGAV
ncbi:MAG: FAD-binding oxidoreductase, partial [Steroidobacteraceae bacterium]